jgi:hypothetical protein
MKSLGKLLGNFVVKNDDNRHLFKVFFYENGLSFDAKFLKGIMENDKTRNAFNVINEKWSSGNHDKNEIMERILHLLNNFQEELAQYFYTDEELNENGELIEESIGVTEEKDKYSIYFDYIKENKELKEIKRKDFESKIVDKKVGEFYVENFEEAKNVAKFFKYKTEANEDSYIMVVDDKIKIGFVDK